MLERDPARPQDPRFRPVSEAGTLWKGPQCRGPELAGFLWGFAPPQGCAQGSGSRSRAHRGPRAPGRGPAARIAEGATKTQSPRPRRAGGLAGSTAPAQPSPSASSGRWLRRPRASSRECRGTCPPGSWVPTWRRSGDVGGGRDEGRGFGTRGTWDREAWRGPIIVPVDSLANRVPFWQLKQKKGKEDAPPHL